jgi:hypothetical protein
MAPFSWRVSSLLEAVYKPEVAAYKRGSIAKLTSKPVTETEALEAAAEYLSGSAGWYAWRAREDLMITPKFKSLGVTDFRSKSARELRDSRLEKKSIGFVHQASRYRGKANYWEALFLAYGPATEMMLSGFAYDTAIVLKAFLAMAGAFAKHKIGTELWSAFVADVDAQKAFTASPIDVWS